MGLQCSYFSQILQDAYHEKQIEEKLALLLKDKKKYLKIDDDNKFQNVL